MKVRMGSNYLHLLVVMKALALEAHCPFPVFFHHVYKPTRMHCKSTKGDTPFKEIFTYGDYEHKTSWLVTSTRNHRGYLYWSTNF